MKATFAVRVVPKKEIEFFRSEGVSACLGHTPVIDDDTLVVAQRFRAVERDDTGGR